MKVELGVYFKCNIDKFSYIVSTSFSLHHAAFSVPLLCPKISIAKIAEPWNDVFFLVETVVHRHCQRKDLGRLLRKRL